MRLYRCTCTDNLKQKNIVDSSMREILSWILCMAFTAHTAQLLSMASLSLTKARPIQTDRWLYFHAREFRKRPSRFIIWHAVTKPTRPNPRIFAIFKSTNACHYIIHARYTVKTDIRNKNENLKPQYVNFNLQVGLVISLSPWEKQCTVTFRCNFHFPCQRTTKPRRAGPMARDANQFGIHDGIVRFNRHLYLTFPNSKNIISRIRLFNDAMRKHLLPNFHTSDLWSRTYDRRVTAAGVAVTRDQ